MTWKWLRWTTHTLLTNNAVAPKATTMTTQTTGTLGTGPYYLKKRKHVGKKKHL